MFQVLAQVTTIYNFCASMWLHIKHRLVFDQAFTKHLWQFNTIFEFGNVC